MGISFVMEEALRQLRLPKKFSVCEFGSQMIVHTIPHRRAADLYQELGCGHYVSIDANGQGTMFADLNSPLEAIGEFDLVTDFGTGEHIFDQAQVFRSMHALTKVGGIIAIIRPEQGYPDHGFYNTHATLFHDLAFANSYEILRLQRIYATRGQNWFTMLRKQTGGDFQVPQQGRYKKSLKL